MPTLNYTAKHHPLYHPSIHPSNLVNVSLEESQLKALLQFELPSVPEMVELSPGGPDVVDQLFGGRHGSLDVRVGQRHGDGGRGGGRGR